MPLKYKNATMYIYKCNTKTIHPETEVDYDKREISKFKF